MSSSFQSGTVNQLFATPVWAFRPMDAEALAQRLSSYVLARRAADPAAAQGGDHWQSRDDLHGAPELAALVALIDEASLAVRSLLQVACELALTGMWANVSLGSAALHEHTQIRILRPRTLAENPLNALELEYPATTGALLVFPAWLEHSVRPGRASEERITIAWNQMIRGPLGSRELLAYSEP
jgi:hypothetical protein